MLVSALRAAALISVSALAVCAADPFLGNWKLDLQKSKITGQTIRIAELPDNTYEFQEDEHTDVILADGLDHATHRGETMAITKRSDSIWAITYKDGDRVLENTVWEVSPDGKKLTYTATGTRSNGQHFTNEMIAKRTSGDKGLGGTWESTEVDLSSPDEIHITLWGKDGHSILFPVLNKTIRMRFDDKPYDESGPTAVPGATTSGHRVDDRTIDTTERSKGMVVETVRAAISPDGNTQTLTISEPGDPVQSVMVYQREAPGK